MNKGTTVYRTAGPAGAARLRGFLTGAIAAAHGKPWRRRLASCPRLPACQMVGIIRTPGPVLFRLVPMWPRRGAAARTKPIDSSGTSTRSLLRPSRRCRGFRRSATARRFEVHPYFRQSELLAVDSGYGIVNQAWSPIGDITFYRDGSHGSTLEDPVIGEIAAAHGKSPAQVMLRWHIQQGRQVIPKSVTPSRIAENFAVFDFELTADQLAAIDALDTGVRGGPEPEQITRAPFGIEIPEP